MVGKDENLIFVGGLSGNFDERQLENVFSHFGKVIEAQIVMERDTGHPCGFGFVTNDDRRVMEDAIRETHGLEFGERVICVNRAQPKMGGEEVEHGYREGYSSSGRRS